MRIPHLHFFPVSASLDDRIAASFLAIAGVSLIVTSLIVYLYAASL